MLLEHIRFKNRQALKVEISTRSQIDRALKTLGLVKDRPVIVIVGGAGGITKDDWPAIEAAMEIIATIAQTTGATVVDGGTDSGVMAAMGKARTANDYAFPLIGVAAEGTVTWPGRQQSLRKKFFSQRNTNALDPNHTHFVLVPGKSWGDESPWIAEVATRLAAGQPSLTILLNGGKISREHDIPNSLAAGRHTLVIAGTGRAADAIASQPAQTELMHFVHVNKNESLANEISQRLQPTR